MAAVYPFQYKSFVAHRDLLDDVAAAHVNNLQDEVAAIQQTLGIAPHQDKNLKMVTNSWSSVADRLDKMQRGKGIPVIYLSKSSDSYKSGSGIPMKTISWPAPNPRNDPEGLFNGHSITANRTGWWIVFARCKWGPQTPAAGTDREIALFVNGQEVMSQDLPPIGDGFTHMHIGWQGWVTKGRTIDLKIYHPVAGKTFSATELHLSASMLRESDFPDAVPF